MLNPFKRVIVYPRFRDIGWSSYAQKPLKRNKFFQWYAWSPKGIDIHDIRRYKPCAIALISEVCEIKDEPRDGLKHFLCCYSKQDDSYVGTPFDVFKFASYYEIRDFYKAHPDDKVASIGFNPEKERWYGWSHRAIYSFGVGDEIKYSNDLLILTNGWLEGAPKYDAEQERINKVRNMFEGNKLVIKDLDQARFLAIRFSESVA